MAPFLPPITEYVISIKMKFQQKLYEFYLNNLAKKGAGLLGDYHQFSQICSHPKALLETSRNQPSVSKKGKKQEDTGKILNRNFSVLLIKTLVFFWNLEAVEGEIYNCQP